MISTSRSTLACVRSISISVDLSTSAVISGVVEYEDMPDIAPVPADSHDIVVIGAGPAGLTAAFQLHKHGVSSTVLEADDTVADDVESASD